MQVRAGRYRRVSSDKQEDNSSLETQLKRMDEYCTKKGYLTSPDTLYTEVMTGVIWRERPELQKALREVHKYDVLVIDITDRIGRGEPIIIVMEELRYHDKRLESVQDPIEDTAEGMLLLNIHAYTSKKEWARTLKRTQDGREAYVRAGKQLGNFTKYGYMWNAEHTHYIPHPEERKVVEQIFTLAKAGWTHRAIARYLNEQGIPTRTGDKWQYGFVAHILHDDALAKQYEEKNNILYGYIRELAASGMSIRDIVKQLNTDGIPSILPSLWKHNRIGAILRDPLYKGQGSSLKYQYTRRGVKRIRTNRPKSEQIPISVPALVDEETWKLAQASIEHNKRYSIRNNKHPEASLLRGGFAYCGYCEGRMAAANIDEGTNVLYICERGQGKYGCFEKPTITASKIDHHIWDYCCEIIRDPIKRQKIIDDLKSQVPELPGAQGLRAARETLELQLSNTIEMGRTATTEKALAQVQGWIKYYEGQLKNLAEEEKKFSEVKDFWGEVEAEIQRFHLWCQEWVEKLDKAKYGDKRTVLDYLGIKVYIFKFGHRPRWTIRTSPPNLAEKLGFVSVQS